MANPIVSRIQFSLELRKLRERSGVSREAVAEALDSDLSRVSRLENAKGTLRLPELHAVLDLLGVPKDARADLERLARASRGHSTYRVPDWAQKFAGIEQASSALRTYETELVPGLLQTEGYIRAVAVAGNPARGNAEVDRLVAGRLDRQRMLTNDHPPQYWAVINEAVLRRRVGTKNVMEKQLSRLLELAETPTISLHVMPFSAGAHASMGSSFVLVDLPSPIDARIVYLEDLMSADYLEQPEQIKAYSLAFERLLGSALGPRLTVDLIDEVRRNL